METIAPACADLASAILAYWFGEGYESRPPYFWPTERAALWFKGGPAVDEEIKQKFGADLEAIAAGEFDDWQRSTYPCLAGVILMDQFSRNLHRGTAQAFALDPKSRQWASYLLASGRATELAAYQRAFLYLTFEHSEALEDQERAVKLFQQDVEQVQEALSQASNTATAAAAAGGEIGGAEAETAEVAGYKELLKSLDWMLQFAVAHRDVIAKWGRFPHRNQLLGREATPEEVQGMKEGTIPKWG